MIFIVWRKPSLKYIEYTILWKWSPIRRGKVSADTSTKVCEWQNGKREIEPFIFSIRHGVFSIYILGSNVPTNEYSYSWRFNQAINRKMSPSCTLGFSSLFPSWHSGWVEVDLLAWRNFENWSFERTLTSIGSLCSAIKLWISISPIAIHQYKCQ